MQTIKRTLWGSLILLSLLWFIATPEVFQLSGFFNVRAAVVQYSGTISMAAMSMAMILALRLGWMERWLNGLDKAYRLHKWLGIGALVVSVIHWLWSKGPKWAVGWGWLERPVRGEKVLPENPLEALFSGLRGTAESVGEWSFYAAVVLIALALIKYFPYRLFYKTHRLIALVYLALVFHSVLLMEFNYWSSPVGLLLALLLSAGTYAALVVLLRRVGAHRQIQGKIVALKHFAGVNSLEVEVAMADGWPGHKPGQFAFKTSDNAEGPHPYTIASAWNPEDRRIRFIAKGLGDHTQELPEKLRVGQSIKVEGPYGCFDLDSEEPQQIWIGGGIGITPFIAGMKQLALKRQQNPLQLAPKIDLFHSTCDYDETALANLQADAAAANIRLHILIDSRDGFLTGERIRASVPNWSAASIWFCGPAGFGEALRKDFAAQGLPVQKCFHQELFEMR